MLMVGIPHMNMVNLGMVDPIALLTLCPNSSAQRGVFKQESLQIAFCRPFQKVLYSLNKVWPHFTHVLSKIAALL